VPAGGFGSGVVDPLDTALGHVALTMQAGLRSAAATAMASSVPSDGGGDGGGPAEPGTGAPAGSSAGGSVVGAGRSGVDFSQLAHRFNVDPNPETVQAGLAQAAAQLQALSAARIGP
jgi:hypothetical protein